MKWELSKAAAEAAVALTGQFPLTSPVSHQTLVCFEAALVPCRVAGDKVESLLPSITMLFVRVLV